MLWLKSPNGVLSVAALCVNLCYVLSLLERRSHNWWNVWNFVGACRNTITPSILSRFHSREKLLEMSHRARRRLGEKKDGEKENVAGPAKTILKRKADEVEVKEGRKVARRVEEEEECGPEKKEEITIQDEKVTILQQEIEDLKRQKTLEKRKFVQENEDVLKDNVKLKEEKNTLQVENVNLAQEKHEALREIEDLKRLKTEGERKYLQEKEDVFKRCFKYHEKIKEDQRKQE